MRWLLDLHYWDELWFRLLRTTWFNYWDELLDLDYWDELTWFTLLRWTSFILGYLDELLDSK